MSLKLLTLAGLLAGCSSSSYATKEDLARLEGRVQSLEQRGGSSSSATSGRGMSGKGAEGGQGGQGGQQGGPGGEGGMGGAGMGGGMGAEGGQGGAGAQGGAAQGGGEGGEVSAEMQEMEKALAEGMDAMNKGDIDSAKKKLTEVSTKYADSKGAEMAKQILAELEVIGSTAPPLSTESWLQGTGDLTSGKATLVVFFTTENKNAETALGKIQALAAGAKPRGLNVVGVTRTSEAMNGDKLKQWLSGKGITFPVALDKGTTTTQAYKRSAPISAVVVKGGKIVWTGNASRMSDDVLNKYL